MPPGYRPANLLENPSEFGHNPDATWKHAGVPKGQLGAARLQHRLACAVRDTYPDNPARHLAEALEKPRSTDYVRRKLSGQIPITLTELFEWLAVLGPDAATRVGIDPDLIQTPDDN